MRYHTTKTHSLRETEIKVLRWEHKLLHPCQRAHRFAASTPRSPRAPLEYIKRGQDG